MRVLFFLYDLETGGAQRQIAQLANGLAQKKFEVYVATIFAEGQFWDWLEKRGNVRLVSLCKDKPSLPWLKGLCLLCSPWNLRHVLRSNQIDVLYSVLYMTNVIAWISTRNLLQNRLIWGIRRTHTNMRWDRDLCFYLGRHLSRWVPILVANSKAGMTFHESAGYRAVRQVVIPNGIDTETFKPDPEKRKKLRAKWRIDEDQILIGIAGRISPEKGHKTFLNVAQQVSLIYPKVRFAIIGDGPLRYRQELETLACQCGLSDLLVWAGNCTDMVAVYNALDIVVHPSMGEGFPNVIAESMACGTPCIATDVGDSSSIIGNEGVIVRPQSRTELTQALIGMIENLDKYDSHAVRAHITSNFSLDRLIASTEHVIKSLKG